MIFGNGIAAIPSVHTCCPGGCSKCECAQGKPNDGKKKIGNYGNGIAENGKKKCYEIYERVKKSCHVHNIFTTFSQ